MSNPIVDLRPDASLAKQVAKITSNAFNQIKNTTYRLVEHYQHAPRAVASNHLLVQLIQNLPINTGWDPIDYLEVASQSTQVVARAFHLTSDTCPGKLHHNVFFSGSNEFILMVQDPPDYTEIPNIMRSWRNIRAVNVVSTDCTNLALPLLDGRVHSDASEINVIKINYPLLCLMYKAFRDEEQANQIQDPYSVAMWVATYVLPNMLYSLADHVVFNLHYHAALGLPSVSYEKAHVLSIVDPSNLLHPVLEDFAKHLDDHNFRTIAEVCANISVPYHGDARSLMQWPNMAKNNYTRPVLLASRLKLYELVVANHSENDRSQVQLLMRQIQQIANNHLLNNAPLAAAQFERLALQFKSMTY